MIRLGGQEALDIVEQINQFKEWNTQELRDWVESIFLSPELQTVHNMDTCLQAVEELNIREGIYEDIHRC